MSGRTATYVRLKCPHCGYESDNLAFLYRIAGERDRARRVCPSCAVIDKRDTFVPAEPGIWTAPR
jgi:rubredoxin